MMLQKIHFIYIFKEVGAELPTCGLSFLCFAVCILKCIKENKSKHRFFG